jgi:uncharacterized membrane protein YdbT with pleckstrin-like domain
MSLDTFCILIAIIVILLGIFIVFEFKINNQLCKYFGCNPGKPKNGIIYCGRCGKPLTRKLN